MSITPRAAVVRLLRDRPEIVRLVGARIEPSRRGQRFKLPAIVHTLVDGTDVEAISGAAELANWVIQIDCFAEREEEADEIAELVRLALLPFRGDVEGCFIQGIFSKGFRNREYPDPAGGEQTNYGSSRDYSVWAKQAPVDRRLATGA